MESYFFVSERQTTTVVSDDTAYIEKLVNTVCDILYVDSRRLYELDRHTEVKFARWMVWEIMSAIKGYTLNECGKIFGKYDHTTVLHGITQLPIDLETNQEFNKRYLRILYRSNISIDEIKKYRIKRKELRKRRENQIARQAN